MSETITAGHLNATHLGKRITINGKHGIVMSGKLKKSAPTTPSCPISRLIPPTKKTYPNNCGTGRTFTSSCTCLTKSTTISKQPYARTRNYR